MVTTYKKVGVDITGIKKTEISASRGGRTYSINFKINFGKMQEEKRKSRHGGNFDDSGSMDMGY